MCNQYVVKKQSLNAVKCDTNNIVYCLPCSSSWLVWRTAVMDGRLTETLVCGRRTNAYSSIYCFYKAYNTNLQSRKQFFRFTCSCVIHKIQALGITLCVSFDRNTSKRSWNVTK